MANTAGNWQHAARCREVDPELFFPTAVDGPALAEQEAAAKAVCGRCPVLELCRRWAVTQLPYGIAGGLTEDERRVRRVRASAGQNIHVPVNASRREQAAAGRAALQQGLAPAEVARVLGVSDRSAQRWAAQIGHSADGGHGGNRASVLISHISTQAGTAMEGHRG